jgi:hypothetical protein
LVRRILVRAKFEKPEVSGHVLAYRAVSGGSIRTAARGLSWYTCPDVAFRRAYRGPGAARRPKLFRALVPWVDVIYWGESHGAVGLVARCLVDAVPEPTARQPLQALCGSSSGECTTSRRVHTPRPAGEDRSAARLWSAAAATTKEPFQSAHWHR